MLKSQPILQETRHCKKNKKQFRPNISMLLNSLTLLIDLFNPNYSATPFIWLTMTSSIFAHIFYNNCRKPFNIYVTHDNQSQKLWKICFTTSLSYQTLKASAYKLLRLQSIELCAIIKWVCCIVSFNLRWTTQHYEHSSKLMNYTWSQYCFFFFQINMMLCTIWDYLYNSLQLYSSMGIFHVF